MDSKMQGSVLTRDIGVWLRGILESTLSNQRQMYWRDSMAVRQGKRRKRVAESEEDKSGFQPSDASSDSVTQGDALGWDNDAPLALDVALSEDEKNRIVEKAHREFLASGIVIRDVF